MSKSPEATGHHNSTKLLIFLFLIAIQFRPFQCDIPCMQCFIVCWQYKEGSFVGMNTIYFCNTYHILTFFCVDQTGDSVCRQQRMGAHCRGCSLEASEVGQRHRGGNGVRLSQTHPLIQQYLGGCLNDQIFAGMSE